MERKTNPLFRRELIERLGTTCANCGSTENIEYHHIVPISRGGSDRVENMVALCYECHAKVHGKKPSENEYHRGRKRINPSGFEYVMEDYLHCRIGTSECKEIMGYAQNTHLTDRENVRQYMREHGIKAFRNNVDILRAKKKRIGYINQHIAGWVEYEDGRREEYTIDGLKVPIVDKGSHRCQICHKKAKWAQRVIPIDLGGESTEANWVYMCGIHSEPYRRAMEIRGADITKDFERRL